MPENYVILWHKKTRKLRNFLAQKNDHFRIVPVHFRTNQLAIQSKTRTNSYELVHFILLCWVVGAVPRAYTRTRTTLCVFILAFIQVPHTFCQLVGVLPTAQRTFRSHVLLSAVSVYIFLIATHSRPRAAAACTPTAWILYGTHCAPCPATPSKQHCKQSPFSSNRI